MDRWQKQQKEDELGCSDSDAYVRSAMGGRDCAAVAETGECESIRALGEPNLVCSCSCLPVRLSLRFRSLLLSRVLLTFCGQADRATMPPASILGGTGFIMRDLKTLLRGVAAKACLIGPQMYRQVRADFGAHFCASFLCCSDPARFNNTFCGSPRQTKTFQS